MAKVCRWNACNQAFGQLEDLLKHVDSHIAQAQPRLVDEVPHSTKRKLSETMISQEAMERWKRSNTSTNKDNDFKTVDIDAKVHEGTVPVASISLKEESGKPVTGFASNICQKCQSSITDSPIECDICHLDWHAACYSTPSPDKAFVCTNCTQMIATKS